VVVVVGWGTAHCQLIGGCSQLGVEVYLAVAPAVDLATVGVVVCWRKVEERMGDLSLSTTQNLDLSVLGLRTWLFLNHHL